MNLAFTLDLTGGVADPSSISGLLAWFNPSGIAGANGALMTTWGDSGPSGFVPIAITGGVGPTVATNALNGFTVANNAATVGLKVVSGFALSAQDTWTSYGIIKWTTSGTYYCGFQGDGNNTGVRLGAHGGAGTYSYVLPNVIDNGSTESMTLETWHTIIAISNAGVETVYIDGVQLTLSGTHFMSAGGTAFQLCGDNGVHSFNGRIAELGWYDKALSVTERSTLFTYATSKYGI